MSEAARITITHFVNPQLFWYRETHTTYDENDKIARYEQSIRSLYDGGALKPVSHIRIGMQVAVFFMPWRKLIRACAMCTIPNQHKLGEFMFHALDYGFPFRSTVEQALKLPPYLLRRREYIHCGSLLNVFPAIYYNGRDMRYPRLRNRKWSNKACGIMEALLRNAREITFTVQITANGQRFGELVVCNELEQTIKLTDHLIGMKEGVRPGPKFSGKYLGLLPSKILRWLTYSAMANYQINRWPNLWNGHVGAILQSRNSLPPLIYLQFPESTVQMNQSEFNNAKKQTNQTPLNNSAQRVSQSTFNNDFPPEKESFLNNSVQQDNYSRSNANPPQMNDPRFNYGPQQMNPSHFRNGPQQINDSHFTDGTQQINNYFYNTGGQQINPSLFKDSKQQITQSHFKDGPQQINHSCFFAKQMNQMNGADSNMNSRKSIHVGTLATPDIKIYNDAQLKNPMNVINGNSLPQKTYRDVLAASNPLTSGEGSTYVGRNPHSFQSKKASPTENGQDMQMPINMFLGNYSNCPDRNEQTQIEFGAAVDNDSLPNTMHSNGLYLNQNRSCIEPKWIQPNRLPMYNNTNRNALAQEYQSHNVMSKKLEPSYLMNEPPRTFLNGSNFFRAEPTEKNTDPAVTSGGHGDIDMIGGSGYMEPVITTRFPLKSILTMQLGPIGTAPDYGDGIILPWINSAEMRARKPIAWVPIKKREVFNSGRILNPVQDEYPKKLLIGWEGTEREPLWKIALRGNATLGNRKSPFATAPSCEPLSESLFACPLRPIFEPKRTACYNNFIRSGQISVDTWTHDESYDESNHFYAGQPEFEVADGGTDCLGIVQGVKKETTELPCTNEEEPQYLNRPVFPHPSIPKFYLNDFLGKSKKAGAKPPLSNHEMLLVECEKDRDERKENVKPSSWWPEMVQKDRKRPKETNVKTKNTQKRRSGRKWNNATSLLTSVHRF